MGYGNLDFGGQEEGAVCCWSLKNPEVCACITLCTDVCAYVCTYIIHTLHTFVQHALHMYYAPLHILLSVYLWPVHDLKV